MSKNRLNFSCRGVFRCCLVFLEFQLGTGWEAQILELSMVFYILVCSYIFLFFHTGGFFFFVFAICI